MSFDIDKDSKDVKIVGEGIADVFHKIKIHKVQESSRIDVAYLVRKSLLKIVVWDNIDVLR